MSAEALLFLVLFVLLPLVERILQSARRRKIGTPDRPTEVPRPLPPSMRRPPPPPAVMDARLPRTPDVPPLSATLAARPSPRLQLAAPPERRAARRRNPGRGPPQSAHPAPRDRADDHPRALPRRGAARLGAPPPGAAHHDSRRPIRRARLTPLEITPRWLNACGSLPGKAPLGGSIFSGRRPRGPARAHSDSYRSMASSRRPCARGCRRARSCTAGTPRRALEVSPSGDTSGI
jgi:hypothetical protein